MFVFVAFSIVVALLVFRALAWYHGYSALKDKFSHIPGPQGWPLLGSIPELLYHMSRKTFCHLMFFEYPEKYGRVLVFWTGNIPRIGLFGAKYVEPLLNSTRLIKKSIDYDLIRDWLGDGLLLSNGDKWKTRRRLLTPAFHFSILESFLPVFVRHSETFTEVLREKGQEGEWFDVFPLASLCALDVMCECSMGVDVQAQTGVGSEYVRAVKRISSIANARSLEPWYGSDFVFYLTGPGREQKRLLKIAHKFTRDIIEQRRKELEDAAEMATGKKRPFLDLLLSPQHELSDSDIREEVDTFMFEGHDTTSAGISWCLYSLGLNPEIQEKAYQEINDVLDKHGGVMDSKSLHEMKYLECCIKEAQRLYPSVPVVVRDATEDFQAGEYTIPKGAQVSVMIFSVHRDPEIYPEPERYNPDRFFIDEVSKRHPYAYIPFSAGSRNCIGQKFALLEEKIVIANTLKNFKIKSRDPPSSVTLMNELILKSDKGLYIQIEPR